MQIFNILLRLYPPEYQAVFSLEMLSLLKEKVKETNRPYLLLVLTEGLGLLKGAAMEWTAKLTNRNYLPDQYYPDGAGHETSLPAEVTEAQKLVQSTLVCMERAIANHQFEKARFYSDAERRAREHLRLLQQKYNIVE